MNGAESAIRALRAGGVDVCFTNPGTTELHFVEALDRVPEVRAVLGLFEGVCTGAADGYARMAGRPASVLLHLGPGLANGVANLHNARRAHSPAVVLVGEHGSGHVANDPPLASAIDPLARTVSKWVHTSSCAADVGRDAARAFAEAVARPAGIATLIVPAECASGEGKPSEPASLSRSAAPLEDAALATAVTALRERGGTAALLLGSDALCARGLRAAGRLAAATGAPLYCETFPARAERGPGLPRLRRLPYFPEQISSALESHADLLLIGAREPVAFFAESGPAGRPVPRSCRVHSVAGREHDAVEALEALVEALRAPAAAAQPDVPRPERPSGPMTPATLAAAVCALQPDGAIVVDEGVTSSGAYWETAFGAGPSSQLALTGGAIGQGMPCAVGAALACPDRSVIVLEGDGSGLYTPQALWTMAREQLDVTVLICANREYRILRLEMARASLSSGPQVERSTSLMEPAVDWVSLARGFGVPAARVESADSLVAKLTRAFAEPGPHLIEALL